MKNKLLVSLIKNKIWNISDWSLEIPVLHWEMQYGRQPIENNVILNLWHKVKLLMPTQSISEPYAGIKPSTTCRRNVTINKPDVTINKRGIFL